MAAHACVSNFQRYYVFHPGDTSPHPRPSPHSTGQTRNTKNSQGKQVVFRVSRCARYCSTEGAGAYNKPGLPNITGGWSNFNLLRPASNVSNYTGAFSANAVAAVPVQGGSYWGWDGLSFNASRSSAIYGASATVTPESANLPAALYLGRFAEV